MSDNMKSKFNKLQIAISVLLILCLAVAFIALPDRSFSEKENRNLTEFPGINTKKILFGEWTSDFGRYISDQFPFRDVFVAVKAYCELITGKGENNGVVKAGNTLVKRPEIGELRLAENLEAVVQFSNACNIKTVTAALPRSADVFAERLPDTYPIEEDVALWREFYSIAEQKGMIAPDLAEPLKTSNAYYRTDHHYTVEGAYITYCELADVLGYTPKDKDFFTEEIVTESFCGTSMRISGYYLTEKDTITLYRYEGDDGYRVVADGKEITLYDFEKADTTDAYAVFLGGNHGRVDITGGEERERLLLIRDSFADSIAPFLAMHYDLTLIDLRYAKDSVRELVRENDFCAVLVLQCISELAESRDLSYLYKE